MCGPCFPSHLRWPLLINRECIAEYSDRSTCHDRQVSEFPNSFGQGKVWICRQSLSSRESKSVQDW